MPDDDARTKDSHTRSVVKAVTWRAMASADTFVLSLLVTGNWAWAGSIASLETLTKIVLFYFHERAWRRIRWGLSSRGGHRRALVKAITWRAVGTADTFFLSWLITRHTGQAASIASFETVTKVALFYLHEQIWNRIPWGRARPAEPASSLAAAA